jgi:hypothetical protein
MYFQGAVARLARMTLSRAGRSKREAVRYHVVLTVDAPHAEDETVETIRSRMGLLNSAMARVIQGAEDYAVTMADYVQGCLELDVWTRRVYGIKEARVAVSIRRVESSPVQLSGIRTA